MAVPSSPRVATVVVRARNDTFVAAVAEIVTMVFTSSSG
jgi:hypothetical protein